MKRILGVILGLGLAANVSATEVTFTDFVHNVQDDGSIYDIQWSVTIDNDTAGVFTFNVSIDSGPPYADITGFGFDTDIDYGSSILDDISNSSVAVDDAGGNANWNGALASIDYAVSVSCGGASCPGGIPDFNTSFSFQLDDMGVALDENTFSLVAIRGQSVGDSPTGDGNNGSVKDFSDTATNGGGNKVPELSAAGAPLALFVLVGIFALGLERRQKVA